MINIYPFKALTPLREMRPIIHNNFVLYNNDNISLKKDSHEDKLIYINKLLENKLLYQHKNESFYCCRISNKFYSVMGLIALVNINSVGKDIFKHEKCIISKEKIYATLLKKYNIQISPVILVHEYSTKIDQHIENLINNYTPFITVEDSTNKYELWATEDCTRYKELYSTIDCCLIADGHHRISAISNFLEIDNTFVTAFFTSVNYIKTLTIYREYKTVDVPTQERLKLFLTNNFILTKISNATHIIDHNKFLFKIGGNSYEIENNNSNNIKCDNNLRRFILEFLDQSINYDNENINFYNFPFYSNQEFIKSMAEVSMLIPAFKINNNYYIAPLYPPHSTMFYPKLPEGLVNHFPLPLIVETNQRT